VHVPKAYRHVARLNPNICIRPIPESCTVDKEPAVPFEWEAGVSQSQYELQLNFTYPDTGYPDRLGPSGKHLCTALVIYIFMA